MDNTVAIENGLNEVPERSYGYTGSGTRFSRTDHSITSAVLGDGGVYTSISEYALWDAALYHTAIVRPETLDRMFDPGRLNNGSRINYAMGWSVDTWNRTRRLSHTGSTIGFRSSVLRFPDKKLTVVVLVNRANVAPWEKAEQIARMYWKFWRSGQTIFVHQEWSIFVEKSTARTTALLAAKEKSIPMVITEHH